MVTSEEVRTGMSKFVTAGRLEKGMSYHALAIAMGVDSKTIRAWESGKTMPDMYQFSELCDIFGKNAITEHSRIIHPELFTDTNSNDVPIEIVRRQLCDYVDAAPDDLCRQLHYCSCSAHGSYFPAQIQALVALNHLPMQARVLTATNIEMLYDMNREIGKLKDPDAVTPDMALYHSAILHGRESIRQGLEHYTIEIVRNK